MQAYMTETSLRMNALTLHNACAINLLLYSRAEFSSHDLDLLQQTLRCINTHPADVCG